MNSLIESKPNSFLEKHQLPSGFRRIITDHYLPLSHWIQQVKNPYPEIIGISGAQGTGKSTLADFLRITLENEYNWVVATLSLDDFYLTQAERNQLGKEVHPLLCTRGAPGTHDLEACMRCLTKLKALEPKQELALPRFDKAEDDRAPAHKWPKITGPIDAIILEGWCLGSQPQEPEQLTQPVNNLEASRDPDAVWRTYVNDQLREKYSTLFQSIDHLVFLQAPDFKAVYRWRLEQETKLARVAKKLSPGIMNEAQISEFLQHYERLTRENIELLPKIANVTLELDRNHQITSTLYRQ